MSRYLPPFSITPAILNLVVEVGELLGHWSAKTGRQSPLLRKENRIRPIQASLAIEHNSLTTDQVTALVEGKRVLAPAKDIQEVRNAILAYEQMPQWQRADLSDLLSAHRTLGRLSWRITSGGRGYLSRPAAYPYGTASQPDLPVDE